MVPSFGFTGTSSTVFSSSCSFGFSTGVAEGTSEASVDSSLVSPDFSPDLGVASSPEFVVDSSAG